MSVHAVFGWLAVLLVAIGAAADAAGSLFRHSGLRSAGGWLLVAAGACAAGAFVTGSGALRGLGEAIHLGGVGDRADLHAFAGSVGAMALVALAAFRFAWRDRLDGSDGWLTLGAALLSVGIASALAFTGTDIR